MFLFSALFTLSCGRERARERERKREIERVGERESETEIETEIAARGKHCLLSHPETYLIQSLLASLAALNSLV